MSSKGKISTIRVAVCGLTSSCYNGLGGQGPGKSCLCNRLIQSTHDKLHTDHTSVLNLSEFGSNVINNTHFLYWGEKVAVLEDGQEMKFQIVEHTEFVDDSSLKPFSTNKPYHKRCIQLKLQSGGKVTYLEPNQLALPEQYIDVPKFPDKFAVDGFIVCVDVSTNLDDHSDPQKEFFDRVLHNIIGIKKPVVIACTKFDRCKPASMASVLEIVAKSKKQVPVVEVSAVKGVNVDMCFLVLAHLIDPKKPRTRIVSYAESKAQLDERVRRNEEALQYVLDERLVDFSMSLEEANQCLKPIVEYQLLIDLSGKQRVNRLIKAKLNYLKSQLVKYKSASFMKALPHVFTAIVPELELGVTIETAKVKLRRSSKFERYFTDLEDWKENTEFLKSDTEDLVPFSLLDMDEGKGLLETHIDEVLAEGRARVAAEKIKEVLNKTTDILPGVDMTMLWVELGLSADIKRISSEEQVQIYNEYMGKLEQVCVADLTELFLEKSDLFDTISTTSHTKDTFDLVHQELKDVPRYKRLDHRTQLRMSQALKHIGSLQVPGRSPVYGKSGLQDAIETLQNTAMLSRDKLGPGACASEQGEGPCWELDHEGSDIRLCILARTEENMRILRSDFMNHCSGSGAVEVGDKTYHIDMSIQHGHHIHSLATDFVPHGAVAVVTSLECVDWLEDLVARLWGGGDDTTTAPYRGMPLIILALDKETEAPDGSKHGSDVYSGAQAVAGEVQCVCITEFPTPQPMRLVGTSVIHQILLSMVNAFSHLHMFLTSDLSLPKDPAGFNIAVCTLVGDPYPNEDLLRPLLRHQLVYSVKDGHNLFVKCAIEKQHRTCVLSFNSMFNVPELCSGIHLGFILVYSTQRIASLSVLKYLLPKLPSIPKLIVAMTTNKSHDKKCLEEGQQLASQWGAMLVSNSEDELRAGFPTEFLHKCWFQRFSSWKAQNYNDEVRLRGRKQARALPSRPTEEVPGPPSLNPSRHSVDTLLDSVVTVETGLSASTTLPRSPIKPSIFKGSLGSSEESDIYSSPVQQRPKKKLSLPLSPPFGGISPHHHHQLPSIQSGPNILDPAPLEPLGDYASVEDAVKHTQMTAGMVNSLRRQARRTPSMSPPPLPTSPPHVPLEQLGEEEDELDTYATVDTIPRVKSPQQKGYDHLLTEDTTHRGGYDHLNPSPPAPSRPPRNEPPPRSQGSPSASTSGRGTPVYDTMEEREGPMYATIDVCKPKQKRLPPRPVATRSPSPSPKPLPAIKPKPRPPLSDTVDDSMYATVNKPSPGGHQRIKSDDLHNVSGELEQMYSVVQKKPRPQPKPRQSPTPDEPMYSVPEKKKKPPPLAPKPTSASNSRSPTPNTGKDMRIEPRPLANHKHGWTHIRSESFDTGLLTSAPHHSDMRDTRSQSVNQQKRQAVHKKALSDQRSPSPELTPREIKLIKHQQKLLHKLQKKLEKESEHRRRQEERKRRREEEQLKKERRKKAKKSKYPQKHAEPAERSRYFGSPLSHVVGSDGVPEFIRKCVDFIEHGGGKGMDTVGLYRVSGKKDDILALQEKYDQDPTLDITTLGLFESCISSTLKAFFKLLPEPLISNELASQLLVINALDAESQRTRIHEILASMPHPNLSTFRYLMQHLYNVQSQQEVNKMNASNLAIVFWPTLMRPPLMDLADPSKQLGWQLVMTRVIEHPDFVPIAL